MFITYFLVRNLPSTYTAETTLATGLVDETQHSISVGGTTFQESHINQQFTNVVEMIKLGKMIDKVSYLLIVHDLSQPDPFRKPSKLVNELTNTEKERTILFFKDKYAKEETLNLWDEAENKQAEILKSMKYDDGSIRRYLNVYRKSNSDYIEIEFNSDNAELSPFVVNTICKEFIKYYDSVLLQNKNKTSGYLGEMLRKKYNAMNEKIALLKNYKIQNRILNLNEESKILYTSIILNDSRKLDAQKDIEAFNGAIDKIEGKFDPNDRKYLEGALTKLNENILLTKTRLQILSDAYLKSNYDDTYKKSIDSIQKVLFVQINALSDQYIYDPLSTKKDLMTQKLSLEVQRDISKNSLDGLDKELALFNQRFNRLVPFEAVVQSYERDIDIASKEYLDVINRFNQFGMDNDNSIKLSQIEVAMPTKGTPTKAILFILLSGIVIFILSALLIFILFFFDKSISTPEDLVLKTQLPVLGQLIKLNGNLLNLSALWHENDQLNAEFNTQKSLLRSIRFEVIKELGAKKTICITSLKSGSGNTFFAINLAYAFATMHKKVLLIDGNFIDSAVSSILKPTILLEDFFNNPLKINNNAFITVVGNNAENRSPFEIASEQKIKSVFDKIDFDIIIIDTASLNEDNKTKEWAACADKIIGVFEKGQKFLNKDEQQTSWLKQEGKFAGWVFNKYLTAKA